jgi:hypothetical protein
MPRIRLIGAGIAAAVALLAPAAHADVLEQDVYQSLPLGPCQSFLVSLPPGAPDIRKIEVCPATAYVAAVVIVGGGSCTGCIAILSPAAAVVVPPTYFRIYTGTGVLEVKYPNGTGRIETPSPTCIWSNDPAYTNCLL